MKKKIGTLMDEQVLRRAKRRAAEEGRPLNDLFQAAVSEYLARALPESGQREEAYRVFCERPIPLSPAQFKQIVNLDAWGDD
jgi:hypothetical protein